jgi:ABC-type transport system involved in multi-copper enzyme maturation permease subunit
VAIVFISTYLVGFRPAITPVSYVMAFIILSVFSFYCVGFGLVAATLVKPSSTATGAAFFFIIPQMLLGTYISFNTSSMMQEVAKFIPSYYVTDALMSLFLMGASPSSPTILFDALTVTVSSILVLVLSIALFRKYGKT